MRDIAQKYHRQYGPMAEVCFARDLMAGYSRENAILATAEAFDLSRDEVEAKLDAANPSPADWSRTHYPNPRDMRGLNDGT